MSCRLLRHSPQVALKLYRGQKLNTDDHRHLAEVENRHVDGQKDPCFPLLNCRDWSRLERQTNASIVSVSMEKSK